MKKLLVVLLTVITTAGMCFGAAAEESYYALTMTGLDFAFDDKLEESLGYVMIEDMGALDFAHHVYMADCTYFSMPRETVLTAIVDPELSTTSAEEIMAHETIIRVYFATDAGLDEAREAYDYIFGEHYPLDYDRAVELGREEGYTFYAVPNEIEEYKASLPEEYVQDLQEVEALLIEGEQNADFYAPHDEDLALIGQKLEFTTTDLDGNTVTSGELFAQNRITLVNVWGTWCGNCVAEMEDLARLHEKMQEKGCGIVGVDYERTDDPEGPETAKALLQELGAAYPNVMITDDIMEMCVGYPMTFFVDSEGTLLLCPIIGAKPGMYEPAFEYLLEDGEQPENMILSDKGLLGNMGTEFASQAYTVSVQDENGPVPGVMIQFCDDETCRLDLTDEAGVVRFEVPAGKQYEVHILAVPEGYEEDTAIYKTETTYGQTDLTLRKK